MINGNGLKGQQSVSPGRCPGGNEHKPKQRPERAKA